MKKLKEKRGITLIALVITIIVLLILAGVTIATLTGDNGLLQKATDAKIQTIEAEGLERIKLEVMASRDENGINTTSLAKNLSEINGLTDTNNQAITENREITLPIIIKINNNKYIVKEDGDIIDFGKEYLKEGLLLYLDGINNTRNGHCTTTTTWEDLSGNNNDFTKLSGASNAQWNDNSYVGDASNRALVLNNSILSNATECTVEVCYDVPDLKTYWVFQSRQINTPANGFQFIVYNSLRQIQLYNSISNYSYNYMKREVTDKGKKTLAFAVNNVNVTFSDNCVFENEDIKNGVINSLNTRDCYTIGSAYPWFGGFFFKGHIYSIRIYNRKLSEEELRNNNEVDKVRFNID